MEQEWEECIAAMLALGESLRQAVSVFAEMAPQGGTKQNKHYWRPAAPEWYTSGFE